MNPRSIVFSLLLILILIVSGSFAQEPTAQQKQAVRAIKTRIDRAGKLYTTKKFGPSGKAIEDAIEQLEVFKKGPSPAAITLLKPEYDRLQIAHRLLTEAGEKLVELPPLPTPMIDGASAVSFTKTIAPILVAKCGSCHVNRNRGNFNSATFAELDKSTTLAYGLPQDSRLIQVIESGEMPKGGGTVEPAELQLLKEWILQGAKFDGANPQQNLNEFVSTNAPPDRGKTMPIVPPTGRESVSFGLHIAPILVEHCGSCHMVNNPRGNFNQSTFQMLIAGGDGGTPIVAGKPDVSLLLKRIAAGEMPPSGKLADPLIKLVETWIKEGAKFDARNPRLAMSTVAAVAAAQSQTHAQLQNARKTQSAKMWKLAMGRVEGQAHRSDNYLVTGSANETRLDEISQLLESLTPKIAASLKSDSSSPLVKGNISVFIFEKRYDFSEFGKMVEQRDFPKQSTGYWNYTITDAYATMLMTQGQTAADAEIGLAQQVAALHVASLAPDVPRWFADGAGYWTAKKIYAKSDGVKSWDTDAVAAAVSMKQPDDFAQDRLPADQAGLVSYLYVKTLRSKASNFYRLLDLMRGGETFESAFSTSYGMTPTEMIQQAGKNGW